MTPTRPRCTPPVVLVSQPCCVQARSGEAGEYTDVLFSGVVAYRFGDVPSGNINFDMQEVDVTQFVGT